ncbi:MAG: cytochrome c [Nitrospira sp.]|nr:MAG: cytochrome c [Nitrospira sp.]
MGEPMTTEQRHCHWWKVIGLAALLLIITVGGLLAARFLVDEPVRYAEDEDHFKYGSLGGEREAGFPYWIWKALPRVCAAQLPEGQRSPGQEYTALGFIYEGEKPLPVGMSMRRHMGVDRVFLNCASCHASTVRETPASEPRIYTGMPAHRLNLMAFERFLFDCAKSAAFTPDLIVPAIQELGGELNLLDQFLVYPTAVHLMRARLVTLDQRLSFMLDKGPEREWGPGRVDTWAFGKALLNFRMDQAPDREHIGVADFPSIWLQEPRQGMQLHWDGNNTSVEERNRSAAFGTGATPPTLDRLAMKRLEDWLLRREPPAYPFPVDTNLAAKGAPIYKQYCSGCHGESGRNFGGESVGTVVPISEIKTDRHKLDSYTLELAVNQNLLYAGTNDPTERFSHFRKTNGYANMPLDGIWLRAPYLHNGSVPTLRDLLEPRSKRPTKFYRGYDVYDQQRVGFVSTVSEERGQQFFLFDTTDDKGRSQPGNGRDGHEGARYGTELSDAEKAALVEYLKTF